MMTNERTPEYDSCLCALNAAVNPNKGKLPSRNEKESTIKKVNRDIWENRKLPILYRYVPLNDYAISGVLNEDIYMLSASKMNDVFEGTAFGVCSTEKKTKQVINNAQKNLYLKSFSFDCVNNLMWSHYADAHKGICIEYDFGLISKENDDVTEHLYPVQYTDTPFTYRNPRGIDAHKFLLLRKSRDWEYEKEFRLIYEDKELRKSGYHLKLNCITKIIFGLRTNPLQIEQIKCLLCAHKKNIKLAQIKQNMKSYDLICEGLDWNSQCPRHWHSDSNVNESIEWDSIKEPSL